MKVDAKQAARGYAASACAGILLALLLSGCAVAMLRGASGSGAASAGSAQSRAASGNTGASAGSNSSSAGSGSKAGAPPQAAVDSSTSTAVRSRLAADPALKALKIVVDTHDGIVTLRGQVNTVEQRNAAQVEARAVGGVKGVNNQLTVR